MSNSANITKRSSKQGNDQLSQVAGKSYQNSASQQPSAKAGSKDVKNQAIQQHPKTDFMQTQTFHRRNMSNLINMSEEEDMPDHMLISRGGPPRRTLEQIEQGSSYEVEGADSDPDKESFGNDAEMMAEFVNDVERAQRDGGGDKAAVAKVEEDDDDIDLMDSQESAAENADFPDHHNSNQRKENEQFIPKGGFFDMVEQPSIRDDEQMEMIDENEGRAFNFGRGDDDDDYSEEATREGRRGYGGPNEGDDNLADARKKAGIIDFQGSRSSNEDAAEDYDEDGEGYADDDDGDFPVTGRREKPSDLRLDISDQGDSSPVQLISPGGGPHNQIESMISPHPYDNDFKMELSELHQSNHQAKGPQYQSHAIDNPKQAAASNSAAATSSNKFAPNRSLQNAQRASPTGEISQATNESCSSLDTMGHQMLLNTNHAPSNGPPMSSNSAQKTRLSQINTTPSQAYGGTYDSRRQTQHQRAALHHQSHDIGGGAQMQVYQYYNPDEDEDDDDDSQRMVALEEVFRKPREAFGSRDVEANKKGEAGVRSSEKMLLKVACKNRETEEPQLKGRHQAERSDRQLEAEKSRNEASDDVDYTDRSLDKKRYDEVTHESSQEASQIINTASPSPVKKVATKQQKRNKFFKELQIEIDSDDGQAAGPSCGKVQGKPKALPSAPKQQSNFIQFEEVEDSAHIQDDLLHGRVSDAYQIYGGGHLGRSAGEDCDTPGLTREQQISSQKMLTPNEQRMHSSYFPNDAGLQRAMPSTKSYQTPVTYGNSNLNGSQSPFMAATDGVGASGGAIVNHRGNSHSLNMAPLDTGNETNSVSTANPQYYYLKGNGLIGVGQQESQSRASDRIYEKANIQDSHSPGENEDMHGHDFSYSDLQQNNAVHRNLSLDHQQMQHSHAKKQKQNGSLMLTTAGDEVCSEKDERVEAEIRRLEELNRIDAQRLREPATDDEDLGDQSEILARQEAEMRRLQEEETRQNCPDEYNLLSATVSLENVESVEALKNTSTENVNLAQEGVQSANTSHVRQTDSNQQNESNQGASNHGNKEDLPIGADNDLNDRESAESGDEYTGYSQVHAAHQANQLSANNSFRTSSITGDRASRRLYVITEESQSMAGGQTTMDPFRATANDYTTMKQIWGQKSRSRQVSSSDNTVGINLQPQHSQTQNPFMQQNALGYGFLKASTHSQELPLYDPQSRRLTVGSSNNTAEARTSLLLEGTPNLLDLQGSQPQQSLNQTMQVHSSPQVQTFNAYCQQDNESSSITDHQFISMAQINPSADASVVKDCQDAMVHQRSKSQTNNVAVTNFTNIKQKANQSQMNKLQLARESNNANNITIREESSSPLQIFDEGTKHDGFNQSCEQETSVMTGQDASGSRSHPSKFKPAAKKKNSGQLVPCRSAAASTVKQANSSTMVLEQNTQATVFYPHAGAGSSVKMAQSVQGNQQPYLYAQFNTSAAPYQGMQDGQQKNALTAMQSSLASSNTRDQELMSAYLKQTSTLTMNDRRLTNQLMGGPMNGENGRQFDIASDEDLLNSNFDRISKILPNHEQINEQLPDFNPEESAQNSPQRETQGRNSANQTNGINQAQHASQTQMLLAEIQQLKQTILQRNQVIMIKDNTIAELQNEYGLRSSVAGLTTQQTETRDVGSLALPDTKDAKCQTHGPRKQAYYRSIPAKVYTNLPHRSPSNSLEHSHDCSNDQSHHHHSQPNRTQSSVRQSYKLNSFIGTVGAHGSNTNSPGRALHQVNTGSYSPNRRRNSPGKAAGGAASATNHGDGGQQTNEDIRSLRLQLMSLKKQLNAQEQDNMTLIEKVTSLEDTIDTQEKNYDRLQMELEEKVGENEGLIERNEELIKQVDSLLADNMELRQQKNMSFTSEQLHRILQERKAADLVDNEAQTEDYIWQDFLSNQQQYNSRINQSISLVHQQPNQQTQFYDQQSDQKELTGRSIPQSTTQHSQVIVHHIHQPSTSAMQPGATATLPPHLQPQLHLQNTALGGGLMTSNLNSRVIDQLSEVISAHDHQQQLQHQQLIQQQNLLSQQHQQMITITNDQERIQILAERAKSYEQQQARIEQEIAQYKKLLLDVQIPQTAPGTGVASGTSSSAMVMMTAAMSSNQPQTSGAVLGPQPFNLNAQNYMDNAAQYQHGHHSSDLLNVSDTNVKQINVNHYHHHQNHSLQPQQQIAQQSNFQQHQQQQFQQHQQHLRHQSNISASPNLGVQEQYLNTQDYMLRSGGTMSFDKNSSQNLQTTGGLGNTGMIGNQTPNNIVDLHHLGLGAAAHTSVGIVSMSQQQQIGYLHSKCMHQKRKLKKLSKKNQKLEFEKMQMEQVQQEMTKSMEQLNEKYRDLRAKYQLKLQEKNLKISELKNQLQQRAHQLFTGGSHQRAPENSINVLPANGGLELRDLNQQLGGQNQRMTTLTPGADLSSEGGRGDTLNTRNKGCGGPLQTKIQRVDTSQEDNKGQHRVKRRFSPMTATASKHQNQQHQQQQHMQAISVSNLAKGGESSNFYTIVSGMVDQRMAEHGDQDRSRLEGNLRHHESNRDNHRSNQKKNPAGTVQAGQETTPDDRKRYRSRNSRPDLEILRDHRQASKNQEQKQQQHLQQKQSLSLLQSGKQHQTQQSYQQYYQQMVSSQACDDSPAEKIITSQNLVSSSPTDEKLYPSHRQREQYQFEDENFASGDFNDRALPSGSSQRHKFPRQSRNSQPQLIFNHTHKDPETNKVIMTYSSSPDHKKPLQQKETLAESYARKVKANKTYNSRSKHEQSCSPEARVKRLSKQKRRFRSRSSEKREAAQIQKRDMSLRSVLSKDDVMPCYKYKVDGRKRNQVDYVPSVSLLTYLVNQPGQIQDQSRNRSPIISSSSQSPQAQHDMYHPGSRRVKQGSCSQDARKRDTWRPQEGAVDANCYTFLEQYRGSQRQNMSYY